jgi:hypothetical protein
MPHLLRYPKADDETFAALSVIPGLRDLAGGRAIPGLSADAGP